MTQQLYALEREGWQLQAPVEHTYWTAQRGAGPFYLEMEYVPGQTLEGVLQDAGGRVAWEKVLAWGFALCDVLSYLHSRTPPVVFRDLKLPNIMLNSATNAPVLIDFGIARQLASSGGTAIGTWGYVPYEQIMGRAEPRSDIYALGATLHALVTRRHPDVEYARLLRSGLDVEGTMRALFPAVDTLVPGVPAWLGQVLAKATAFAVADRYDDAASMAAAFRHASGPISGGPLRVAPALRAPGRATRALLRCIAAASSSVPGGPGSSASTGAGRTKHLVVAPDGSGDVRSLEDAVRVVAPGTTLLLRAGTHRLSGPLKIHQSLTLVGDGRESTQVVCASPGYVVQVGGNGPFAASEVTFTFEGAQAAHVVKVASGQIDLRRCGFSGGIRDEAVQRGGVGLLLVGQVRGTIAECEASRNEHHGICVCRQAQPVLEGNTCEGNKEDGMYVARTATFSGATKRCRGNKRKDIKDQRPWYRRGRC